MWRSPCALVLAGACGAQRDGEGTVLRGCEGADEAAGSGYATIHPFDSLDDWVANAQVIARLDVVDEARGPVDEVASRASRGAPSPRSSGWCAPRWPGEGQSTRFVSRR